VLSFEKWQGLGNDFIVVEGDVSSEQARDLCNRRRGIGADGVLCVERLGTDAVRMIVRNADGSRPQMCGNGVRCVAGWAALRGASRGLFVTTDAGDMRCDLRQTGRASFEVSAEVGIARVGDDFDFAHAGRCWGFTSVDMGNPHAVSFDAFDQADVDAVGPALERHIDGGANVEFCRFAPNRIEVVVWERGVGRTLACGTGAAAVAAAACRAGRARYDEAIEIALPGGGLNISVSSQGHMVTMRGPADRVYVGEVDL